MSKSPNEWAAEAPSIDPRTLQVLWSEAHAQKAEAGQVAARLRHVGDNVAQLRKTLAGEEVEEERLRALHNNLLVRATTTVRLITGHCQANGLPLPTDPEAAQPGVTPTCPHCSRVIGSNGSVWVHTETGYPECDPRDSQSKVAEPVATGDVRVVGSQPDAARSANGAAS